MWDLKYAKEMRSDNDIDRLQNPSTVILQKKNSRALCYAGEQKMLKSVHTKDGKAENGRRIYKCATQGGAKEIA
jgi:hypothetical protein